MSTLKIFLITILATFTLWFSFHTYANLSLIWLLPASNFDGRVAQFFGTLMTSFFSIFLAWLITLLAPDPEI